MKTRAFEIEGPIQTKCRIRYLDPVSPAPEAITPGEKGFYVGMLLGIAAGLAVYVLWTWLMGWY